MHILKCGSLEESLPKRQIFMPNKSNSDSLFSLTSRLEHCTENRQMFLTRVQIRRSYLMNTFSRAVAVTAFLCAASSAHATVALTSLPGFGAALDFGASRAITSATTVGDFTFTNISGSSQIKVGSSSTGAQPFGTTGSYMSVLGGGLLDMTFRAATALTFFWGSIDTFNKVEIFSHGQKIGSFTGS